jgi:hypothetical protein
MNSDSEIALLDREWRFFRLAQFGGDGSGHLFYRCPACGSPIDWRDMGTHLFWHGVTNSSVRSEIIERQEKYAGVRP